MNSSSPFAAVADHAFVVNHVRYSTRKASILKELDRVGIDSRELVIQFDNPLDEILLKRDPRLSNIWMGHYRALKLGYAAGYSKMMITEDDVVFLNDVEKIREYLGEIPDDFTFLHLDPVVVNVSKYKAGAVAGAAAGMPHFGIYESDSEKWLRSAGCYCITRDAAEKLIKLYEDSVVNSHRAEALDMMYNDIVEATGKPVIYACPNIGVQGDFSKDQAGFYTSFAQNTYAGMSINSRNYNTGDIKKMNNRDQFLAFGDGGLGHMLFYVLNTYISNEQTGTEHYYLCGSGTNKNTLSSLGLGSIVVCPTPSDWVNIYGGRQRFGIDFSAEELNSFISKYIMGSQHVTEMIKDSPASDDSVAISLPVNLDHEFAKYDLCDFISSAIKHVDGSINKAYVFSDDTNECRKQCDSMLHSRFRSVIYASTGSVSADLINLAAFKHKIIPNNAFNAWAGYIGNVIHPGSEADVICPELCWSDGRNSVIYNPNWTTVHVAIKLNDQKENA